MLNILHLLHLHTTAILDSEKKDVKEFNCVAEYITGNKKILCMDNPDLLHKGTKYPWYHNI
jgi:hypothetical protein